MGDVLAMALPFFGLIGLGVLAAKIWKIDTSGLAWMNVFIIYIALPALFFNLLSRTAVEELTNWAFIFGATLGTYMAFAICFCIGIFGSKGSVPESTIQGLSGAYGNIGYMGPGIAIAAFGEASVVPVALIFCFDNVLHFVMAPLLMALSGNDDNARPIDVVGKVLKRIFTHPFIIATIVGVTAAAFQWQPPEAVGKMLDYLQGAAAPCALFAMGVTVALAERGRSPKVMYALVPAKLLLHPLIVYVAAQLDREFQSGLGLHRRASGRVTDRNERVRYRAAIRCLGREGVEHGDRDDAAVDRHGDEPALRDHKRPAAAGPLSRLACSHPLPHGEFAKWREGRKHSKPGGACHLDG